MEALNVQWQSASQGIILAGGFRLMQGLATNGANLLTDVQPVNGQWFRIVEGMQCLSLSNGDDGFPFVVIDKVISCRTPWWQQKQPIQLVLGAPFTGTTGPIQFYISKLRQGDVVSGMNVSRGTTATYYNQTITLQAGTSSNAQNQVTILHWGFPHHPTNEPLNLPPPNIAASRFNQTGASAGIRELYRLKSTFSWKGGSYLCVFGESPIAEEIFNLGGGTNEEGTKRFSTLKRFFSGTNWPVKNDPVLIGTDQWYISTLAGDDDPSHPWLIYKATKNP